MYFCSLFCILYMIRRFTLALIMVAAAITISAQQPDTLNIVGHITADGVNTVTQPAALMKLLKRSSATSVTQSHAADESAESEKAESPGSKSRVAGYRVQVFSDNNSSTAKNEARAKARNISERFPEWRTYVIYNSPYWRLKVGDFRTQREADDAAEDIKRAFPSYGKEVRVVRDRINF